MIFLNLSNLNTIRANYKKFNMDIFTYHNYFINKNNLSFISFLPQKSKESFISKFKGCIRDLGGSKVELGVEIEEFRAVLRV